MTNEEKAKQLYRKYKETNLARESAAFNAAMEMAKWKDEQFNGILKKAVDLLTDNPTNNASWNNKEEKDLLFKDLCARLPYSV